MVRAAATAATKSTARIEQQFEVGDGTTNLAYSVKGNFDMGADRGHLKVNLQKQDGGKAASLEEIFAGRTVYFRMPVERTATLPGGPCPGIRRKPTTSSAGHSTILSTRWAR
ncbi:hypothetical protein M1P56_35190 (plasmid) [Streptomyces sp. HU2014]|uniref:hypothetical protein n=1 Tax=Streptomyces sp. HU2014 TaxID=2939414 RepID=UPI00200D1795|nr:hypothetical protein [Streptomyces sp. HU2014]UQI49759.1 hypothetical protein M1P56_35190 [Streptomyces sp. HU2014]